MGVEMIYDLRHTIYDLLVFKRSMGNLKMSLFLLAIFYSYSTFSQKYDDFMVSLHEKAINKVFTAIGEIKGSSDYEVMLIKGKYYWTIVNPKINLKPDSSDFTCDAKVDVGPFSYKTEVIGNVKISYDPKKNKISIKITRAIFEIYTVVFGEKIHIKDIHLEEKFKDPFIFEGPKTLATDMEFLMPDSTKKKIYVQPSDCEMMVKLREICTYCELIASSKPIKPVIKLDAPIQSADKPKSAATSTAAVKPKAVVTATDTARKK